MATPSAARTTCAGSRRGAKPIPATGSVRRLPRKALNPLRISQLSPLSPLVTQRVDCRLRYKMTVLRKTLPLLGLSPW